MKSETATALAAGSSTSKNVKFPKASIATKPKTAPTHRPVSRLVETAIGALNEKGGSSLSAIKKHIAANNNVDVKRLAPFILRYLVSAVGKGTLIQVKGRGASGSFKLNKVVKEAKPKVLKKPKLDKQKKAVGAKEVKKATIQMKPKAVQLKALNPANPEAKKPEAVKPAKSLKKTAFKKYAAPKKVPIKN